MRHLLALALVLAAVGCGAADHPRDPTDAIGREDIGLPVMSLRWRFELADRSDDGLPQEFASPAVALGASPSEDRLYVGSKDGRFFALDAENGKVAWKVHVGAVSSRPVLGQGRIYVGSDDGALVALDQATGAERWRYATRGPILESPVLAGDLVVFSNEADQVYALDADTGKFRWQYKAETPDEFTLRGHAGVAVDGDLVFTGFANGTLVALRLSTGSVAWLTSLKGEASKFVDVDATPVVSGETVYAASSAGGVFAVDRTTGLTRWRHALEGAGGLVFDGRRLYVAAAETGMMALDLGGNEIWRQGLRGGGEPADPLLSGDYLLFALSSAGLYVADKATGRVLQYFDPGYGISSQPTLARDAMYVLSNSDILYAMSLRRF
jgi:outer membrane protein assembly factor BamB